MTEAKRKEIFDKNQKIIDMVIEKAKTKFPEDIAIIGLTGSFSTGDYHEKSDLDLIIINNTPRGWEIAYGFIYDDVGYDIYCTPWETRIEDQSKLESPMVSCLVELQILYCAKPEYLERLKAYQQQALELLAKPIGKECLDRARKSLDNAKRNYADTTLSEDLGAVRYASGNVIYEIVNALTSMNNTYIKRGVKRYLEDIRSHQYLPDGFEERYRAVIEANTIEEIRSAAAALLRSVSDLFDTMYRDFVPKPEPTYDNLWGTYEELWCNCRNKVLDSTGSGDASYAFLAILGAQNYLDEMREVFGTRKFDLMRHFDAKHLDRCRDAFLRAMEEYLDEYRKVGRTVERFDRFEDLYDRFMSK